MKALALSSVAGIALAGAAAYAHHSIAGAYDTGRSVNVEGVVTEFRFVNPHPSVTIEVRAADGGIEEWRLEMDSRSEMARIGMTAETLRPGDRIVVSGSPSRGDSQSLYIQRLDRPSDGFGYEQVDSSPRLRGAREGPRDSEPRTNRGLEGVIPSSGS